MKNINTISMHREKFYQLHVAQRQLLRPLNNLEKRIQNMKKYQHDIELTYVRFEVNDQPHFILVI